MGYLKLNIISNFLSQLIDVVKKLLYSLTVYKYKDFINTNPGSIYFYGPIWIFAIVVLSISFSQNIYLKI